MIKKYKYNLVMSKIRKLYYFDKKSTEEMISFLNNGAGDSYINRLMFNPFILLHHLLPLKLKFLPESYVLQDENSVKGLITLAPIKSCNPKVEIQKLLFEEDFLAEAAELVQYTVSRYKAMGAVSVIVKVDDYLPELLNMFIYQCGFSQISDEKLWRVTNFPETDYDKKAFRDFRNSDSESVAGLYNDSLLPHFRPLLGRDKTEFQEGLFRGLSCFSEYKYIIEDTQTKKTIGYISIKTTDNENYILDIIQSGWSDLNINSVIHFASDKIKKRNKHFGLFLKSQRYTNLGEKYEEIFGQNGYECVQNQILLTNSSARVLKETSKSGKYMILSDFIPTNGIPT